MNNSLMDKPATKQDIENLRQELTNNMATKDELKKLATKEEIKKLATKDELKKLELFTKEEFKKVDKRLNSISQAVSQIQYQMYIFCKLKMSQIENLMSY